ncbi:hypothetical protein PQE70_gp138 [Bacillus phage vB_BanS_Nate]|uniref:Uncharacterized protein n=1 Tax=Bacillus phage vB_BanS_Nate TaxID=2894788 RepID=A0AAE8YUX8_9CAUD|nr:hypothetical protein PQE70_gp138 [Bacillus phage vB_BanS_Nate]UGO50991.1 hypothetical protein NATE_138 [Bacillus phage vB_BanS_Nate]
MIWKRRKKFIAIWFEYHSMWIKRTKGKHIWHMAIGKCPQCRESCTKPFLLHQNCAYVDELSNYYWACGRCQEYMYDRYQEMWDEYNSGRY